jgi:hypothetical protein
MKVQMTYSIELDKVLKSLSEKLSEAALEISNSPRLLNMSSDLLAEEDASVAFAALNLLKKAQGHLKETEVALADITNILSGYIEHIFAPQENTPKETPVSTSQPQDTSSSKIWDADTKTYKQEPVQDLEQE